MTNIGSSNALAVTISDPLPSGTTYVSCAASQGTCAGPLVGTNGTVTAALGTIVVGGTATLGIQVQAPAVPSVVVNVATVSGSNLPSGSLTVTAVVGVGIAGVADVPFLGPRSLALLALLLVWIGVHALGRGSGAP